MRKLFLLSLVALAFAATVLPGFAYGFFIETIDFPMDCYPGKEEGRVRIVNYGNQAFEGHVHWVTSQGISDPDYFTVGGGATTYKRFKTGWGEDLIQANVHGEDPDSMNYLEAYLDYDICW